MASKVVRHIQRGDGSEVRITATAMYGAGLTRSVDVYVHRRDSSNKDWKLCSDRPYPNWREMSVDEYIKHGRSEMLRMVSHGEILKTTSELWPVTAKEAACPIFGN